MDVIERDLLFGLENSIVPIDEGDPLHVPDLLDFLTTDQVQEAPAIAEASDYVIPRMAAEALPVGPTHEAATAVLGCAAAGQFVHDTIAVVPLMMAWAPQVQPEAMPGIMCQPTQLCVPERQLAVPAAYTLHTAVSLPPLATQPGNQPPSAASNGAARRAMSPSVSSANTMLSNSSGAGGAGAAPTASLAKSAAPSVTPARGSAKAANAGNRPAAATTTRKRGPKAAQAPQQREGKRTRSAPAAAPLKGSDTATDSDASNGEGATQPPAPVKCATAPEPQQQGGQQRTKQQLAADRRRAPEVDWRAIEDPAERRRQRRLAKNRVTAARSRERKKEQWGEMSAQLSALEEENALLREMIDGLSDENAGLRERLASLFRGASQPATTAAAAQDAAAAACGPGRRRARQPRSCPEPAVLAWCLAIMHLACTLLVVGARWAVPEAGWTAGGTAGWGGSVVCHLLARISSCQRSSTSVLQVSSRQHVMGRPRDGGTGGTGPLHAAFKAAPTVALAAESWARGRVRFRGAAAVAAHVAGMVRAVAAAA